MKKGSTMFLRITIILIGLLVLLLAIIGIPWLLRNPVKPDYSHILYPIIIILYLSVIPLFIALYQAMQLLNYIDSNRAFSDISVKSFKIIKYSAFTICGLYVLLMPYAYILAQKEDSPGIIIVGMAFGFASLVVAVFATVLQKLFEEVVLIKIDNDLTI